MTLHLEKAAPGERTARLQKALLQTRTGGAEARAEAAAGLEAFGPLAEAPLCELLWERSVAVRLAAVRTLGLVGGEQAIAALRRLLRSAKLEASRALPLQVWGWTTLLLPAGLIGSLLFRATAEAMVAVLLAAFSLACILALRSNRRTQTFRLVTEAMSALAAIAQRTPSPTFDGLSTELRDFSADPFEPRSARRKAREAAAEIETALRRLNEWSPEPEDAQQAAGLTGDQLTAAIRRETRRATSHDASTRLDAVRTLAAYGRKAAGALRGELQDANPSVRIAAAHGLAAVGGAEDGAALAALLKDRHPAVRIAAAQALGVIGDERTIEPLTAALRATMVSRSAGRQRKVGIAIRIGLVFAVVGLICATTPLGAWNILIGLLLAPAYAGIEHVWSRSRQDRAPLIRAISAALKRIAERSPAPRLAAVSAELRQVASDSFYQDHDTRGAAREAADCIDALLADVTRLPVVSDEAVPAGMTLPRPASAADGALRAPR